MEENKDLYELLAKQAEMIGELKKQVESIKTAPENVNVKNCGRYQNQYLLRLMELRSAVEELKQNAGLGNQTGSDETQENCCANHRLSTS